MRVGIFTEVYKPYVSGVVTSILMLKKSLEDLGHEVYVVTINMDKIKLNNSFNEILTSKTIELFKLKNNYIILNPRLIYEKYINIIDNNINKLELLNPLNSLKRGYAIVKKDKNTIENIKNIKINDKINICIKDGIIDAVITDIKEEV